MPLSQCHSAWHFCCIIPIISWKSMTINHVVIFWMPCHHMGYSSACCMCFWFNIYRDLLSPDNSHMICGIIIWSLVLLMQLWFPLLSSVSANFYFHITMHNYSSITIYLFYGVEFWHYSILSINSCVTVLAILVSLVFNNIHIKWSFLSPWIIFKGSKWLWFTTTRIWMNID